MQGVRQFMKLMFTHKVRECHTCGGMGLWSKCQACEKVHYCSRACQKADWKIHKSKCSKFRDGLLIVPF